MTPVMQLGLNLCKTGSVKRRLRVRRDSSMLVDGRDSRDGWMRLCCYSGRTSDGENAQVSDLLHGSRWRGKGIVGRRSRDLQGEDLWGTAVAREQEKAPADDDARCTVADEENSRLGGVGRRGDGGEKWKAGRCYGLQSEGRI